MNILVTGSGKSGSWKIRGEQLGAAIGADVIPRANAKDMQRYNVVIVVKKLPSELPDGAPVVWDMVDCYPQPTDLTAQQIITGIQDTSRGFTATIAATERMQKDLGADWFLPHHYRSGMPVSDIRGQIKTVGYEGRESYLGEWRDVIEQECKARGWRFVVNPDCLAECDLLLGVRARKWRNYLTDNWKSNVKLANAVGANVPFIGLPESGYMEMDVTFGMVDKPDRLAHAFDSMESLHTRMMIAAEYRKARALYSLEAIASRYSEWLISRF